MLNRFGKYGLRSIWKITKHNKRYFSNPPSWLRKETYDDFPIPQGNWQAYYNEKNKNYNILLFISTIIFSSSLYLYIVKTEFVSCPDEPAPRWYPIDRFAEGEDGKLVDL